MLLIELGFAVDIPKKYVDKSIKTFQRDDLIAGRHCFHIIGSIFSSVWLHGRSFTSLSTDYPQKEPKHLTENVGFRVELAALF